MTALQDLLEETKECHHSLLKQLFANCPVEVLQQMQLIRLRKNQNLISTYQTSNPVFVLLDAVCRRSKSGSWIFLTALRSCTRWISSAIMSCSPAWRDTM